MMYSLDQTVGWASWRIVALDDGYDYTVPAETTIPGMQRPPRPSIRDQRRLWREQAAQKGRHR